MLLLGTLAGACNENTSGGCLLMIILFMLVYYKNNNSLQKWMISGLLGNVCGLIILVLSPGGQSRASQMSQGVSFLSRIFHNIIEYTLCTKTKSLIVIILFVLLIIFKKYVIKQKENCLILSFGYLIIGIISLYVLIFLPLVSERAMFGPTIFMIISLCYVYNGIDFKQNNRLKIWKYTCNIVIIGFSILVLFMIVPVIKETKEINITINKRINLYEKNKGKASIKVKPIDTKHLNTHTGIFGLDDVDKDSNYWLNKSYEKLYNIKSITAK